MRLLLCCLFALLLIQLTHAQRLTHVQGELLVKPQHGVDINKWVAQWQQFEGIRTGLKIQELVSEPMNIWSCAFDFTKVHAYRFLEALRRDKLLEAVQWNQLLEMRLTPNDPQFNLQWQYINVGQSGGLPGADLDMELAWDIATGGRGPAGDTIVVCVIDDGLNQNHLDFSGNIWFNHQEIPNNGIDDDGNGYIDDYRGWYPAQNNDNVYTNATHGTPVAGIIGARGNNGLGVAGVNWQVKLMIVRSFNSTVADIIKAYTYPLVMRKRYNASNGQQGAFVVATNTSWGTPFLFPSDAPLWCAMYDSLGVHGILNAGATVNSDTNVDVAGDLPTTCPSDFLISVTNLDQNDRKVVAGNGLNGAGFGARSIDLGAYGQGVWTTAAPNTYAPFGGTSAATPHVTGAIALLYAAPCAGFAALAKSDPRSAALLARQFIINGVTPNASLAGITVTGGRLNINNSIRLLMNACSECFPPADARAVNISDTSARLVWTTNALIRRIDLRWRPVGTTTWTEIANASSPIMLSNLSACTNYEFQLRTYCEEEILGYGPSIVFRTDGCCVAPVGVQISSIGNTILNIRWDPVLAAAGYQVRLRPENGIEWQIYTTNQTTLLLNNIAPCTRFELQFASICAGTLSAFSDSYFFQTKGCGPCKDLTYCEPRNLDASEEWIAFVRLHTLQNSSASDGGYGDYTGLPAPQLMPGGMYALELRPGFSGSSFTEYFTVWIDFNQNGSFDSNERVFEMGGNMAVFSGMVSIPANALPGVTRMRVGMQFLSPGGPCTFLTNGGAEAEDYCVEIVNSTTATGIAQKLAPAMRLSPNPANDWLAIHLELPTATLAATLDIINGAGQIQQRYSYERLAAGAHTFSLPVSEFPKGLYFLRYQAANGDHTTHKFIKK